MASRRFILHISETEVPLSHQDEFLRRSFDREGLCVIDYYRRWLAGLAGSASPGLLASKKSGSVSASLSAEV